MIMLFRYLRTIHPLSEALRDHLEDILQERTLPRKEHLLKVGQLGGHIYFIEKGLLRRYYIKGEKEISSGFIKEGDICVTGESFFTKQYGSESIQAMEDCILYYITADQLKQVYRDFIEFNIIGRVLLEKSYVSSLQRWQAMWMQPAQDRYEWFGRQFPELLQRVPSKYLASYIGITPVMLSVIKGRR